MVGLTDLWSLYQNSGPFLIFTLTLVVAYIWKFELQPRLDDLEDTQDQRGDKWQDQRLNAQERTMLIDDAHNRLDDVGQSVQRLKARLRSLEQTIAADRGQPVDFQDSVAPDERPDARADGNGDVDADSRTVAGDVNVNQTVEQRGERKDARHGVDPYASRSDDEDGRTPDPL